MNLPKKIRKKLHSLKVAIREKDRSQSSDSLEGSCPTCVDMYHSLQNKARSLLDNEPILTPLLKNTILHPQSTTLERLIARTVASRVIQSCGSNPMLCIDELTDAFVQALESDELELDHTMLEAVQMDMNAYVKRDPACDSILEVLLFYKGFASLVCHRVARRRWLKNIVTSTSNSKSKMNASGSSSGSSSRHRACLNHLESKHGDELDGQEILTASTPSSSTHRTKYVSLWLQSQASAAFGIDIHPAATIGAAVMFDHGTGVVIGETAVIGDYCTFLHGVTLGGTGKVSGDRHPKVGKGVLIGANASILGNIKIGDGAKIGAGSVVLKPIPHGATAVGAPAKIIGFAQEDRPGMTMDASLRNILPIGTSRSSSKKKDIGTITSSTSSSSNTAKKSISETTLDDSVSSHNNSILSPTESESQDDGIEVKMGLKKNVAIIDKSDHNVGLNLSSRESQSGSPGASTTSSDADFRTNITDLSSRGESTNSLGSIFTVMNCPFRQFRCKGLPSGAVSYECLSSVLASSCTEDEIGEIYMALLKLNPDKVFIPAPVIATEFTSIAQKYSALDDEKCEEILSVLKNSWRRGSV